MNNLNHFLDNKPIISLNESYDLLSQVGYFIKDDLGEEEYNKVQDAGVISLQDGDLEILVTTSSKPKSTKADSVTKVLRGYLSVYKKFTGLKENIKNKTKLIEDLTTTLVNKYPIDLNLVYYSESFSEDVIVIESIDFIGEQEELSLMQVIMNDLVNFVDSHSFTLTLNPANETSTIFYSRHGFIENTDEDRYGETLVRLPRKEKLNESVGFVNFSSNVSSGLTPSNMQTLQFRNSIQDEAYMEHWYHIYNEILTSPEYKKRRYEESHGITITKKKLGCKSRVGFAIVGKCNVK